MRLIGLGAAAALATSALLLPLAATAQSQAADAALIARGKALFSDTKLSASGQISCATCHPDSGHTDNKTYVGLDIVPDGDPKGRSTPTLRGAGERSVYSWAGTAPSLEANIKGIIVNRMKGPEPSKEALDALAAYVRSIPNAPSPNIDADGNPVDSASPAIKRGFEVFLGNGGCGTCHVLPTFDKQDVEDVNSGGKFKVPSLRGAATTAPYFHDGRFKNLEEAVRYMAEFFAKANNTPMLTDAEFQDLVAYVKAL